MSLAHWMPPPPPHPYVARFAQTLMLRHYRQSSAFAEVPRTMIIRYMRFILPILDRLSLNCRRSVNVCSCRIVFDRESRLASCARCRSRSETTFAPRTDLTTSSLVRMVVPLHPALGSFSAFSFFFFFLVMGRGRLLCEIHVTCEQVLDVFLCYQINISFSSSLTADVHLLLHAAAVGNCNKP